MKETKCEQSLGTLDKIMIRFYLIECIKNEKINKGLQFNIEDKMKNVNYDWKKSKEILKEMVFNHETDPISTNYVHDRNKTTSNDHSRRFNRSSSRQREFRGRYDRRYHNQHNDRSGSRKRFRTSTPSGSRHRSIESRGRYEDKQSKEKINMEEKVEKIEKC